MLYMYYDTQAIRNRCHYDLHFKISYKTARDIFELLMECGIVNELGRNI